MSKHVTSWITLLFGRITHWGRDRKDESWNCQGSDWAKQTIGIHRAPSGSANRFLTMTAAVKANEKSKKDLAELQKLQDDLASQKKQFFSCTDSEWSHLVWFQKQVPPTFSLQRYPVWFSYFRPLRFLDSQVYPWPMAALHRFEASQKKLQDAETSAAQQQKKLTELETKGL